MTEAETTLPPAPPPYNGARLSQAALLKLLSGLADQLEDAACGIWAAVDRTVDLIEANNAIEAGALRSTVRYLDTLLGDLRQIVPRDLP